MRNNFKAKHENRKYHNHINKNVKKLNKKQFNNNKMPFNKQNYQNTNSNVKANRKVYSSNNLPVQIVNNGIRSVYTEPMKHISYKSFVEKKNYEDMCTRKILLCQPSANTEKVNNIKPKTPKKLNHTQGPSLTNKKRFTLAENSKLSPCDTSSSPSPNRSVSSISSLENSNLDLNDSPSLKYHQRRFCYLNGKSSSISLSPPAQNTSPPKSLPSEKLSPPAIPELVSKKRKHSANVSNSQSSLDSISPAKKKKNYSNTITQESIDDALLRLGKMFAMDRIKLGITPPVNIKSTENTKKGNKKDRSESISNKQLLSLNNVDCHELDRCLKEIQWVLQERNKNQWSNCLKMINHAPKSIRSVQNRYYYPISLDPSSESSYPDNLNIFEKNYGSLSDHILHNRLNKENYAAVDHVFSHLKFMSLLHSRKKNFCYNCSKSSCPRSKNFKAQCKMSRCDNCGYVGHTRKFCKRSNSLLNRMFTLQDSKNENSINNLKKLYLSTCISCGSNDHFICGSAPNCNGKQSLQQRSEYYAYGKDSRRSHPHLYDAWYVWKDEKQNNSNEESNFVRSNHYNNNFDMY